MYSTGVQLPRVVMFCVRGFVVRVGVLLGPRGGEGACLRLNVYDASAMGVLRTGNDVFGVERVAGEAHASPFVFQHERVTI
eukprot:9289584-Pyramimonas_sp.AAC.1